jgi:hypothetical protein
MKNIKYPILITTSVLLADAILSVVYPDITIMLLIFLCSPLLVIWMVYKVLKDGVESSRTFDEYFYDDVDIKRLPVKEETDQT